MVLETFSQLPVKYKTYQLSCFRHNLQAYTFIDHTSYFRFIVSGQLTGLNLVFTCRNSEPVYWLTFIKKSVIFATRSSRWTRGEKPVHSEGNAS